MNYYLLNMCNLVASLVNSSKTCKIFVFKLILDLCRMVSLHCRISLVVQDEVQNYYIAS